MISRLTYWKLHTQKLKYNGMTTYDIIEMYNRMTTYDIIEMYNRMTTYDIIEMYNRMTTYDIIDTHYRDVYTRFSHNSLFSVQPSSCNPQAFHGSSSPAF